MLISKIRPSDGCKGDTVPSTVVRGYDLRKLGGHLGNVGLTDCPIFRDHLKIPLRIFSLLIQLQA